MMNTNKKRYNNRNRVYSLCNGLRMHQRRSTNHIWTDMETLKHLNNEFDIGETGFKIEI